MSQWLSQTRKLNNHYQSGGVKEDTLPYWNLPFTSMTIGGVKIGDNFGFFPPSMHEADAYLNDDGIYVTDLTRPTGTPAYSAHWTVDVDGASVDVYAGLYEDTHDYLTYEGTDYIPTDDQLDGTGSAASYLLTYYDLTKTDGRFYRSDTLYSKTWRSINGEYALIPCIKRYKFFYYAKPASTALPDEISAIVASYPDTEGTPDIEGASTPVVTSAGIAWIPPAIFYNWTSGEIIKRCPGDGPISLENAKGYGAAETGSIRGTYISSSTKTSLSAAEGQSQRAGFKATASCYVPEITTGNCFKNGRATTTENARSVVYGGYCYSRTYGSDTTVYDYMESPVLAFSNGISRFVMLQGDAGAKEEWYPAMASATNQSGYGSLNPYRPADTIMNAIKYGSYYAYMGYYRVVTDIKAIPSFTFFKES